MIPALLSSCIQKKRPSATFFAIKDKAPAHAVNAKFCVSLLLKYSVEIIV